MHPAAAKLLFEKQVCKLTPALAERRGWILHLIDFPSIDCAFTANGRTTLRLRLHCDDWNDLPPAITLHAGDGDFLSQLPPNPTGVFNPGPHPYSTPLRMHARSTGIPHTPQPC